MPWWCTCTTRPPIVGGHGRSIPFWDGMFDNIRTFKVQVLMGDFNMSLFRVIPELRRRGAQVDLGAWYPWKSMDGEPMSDSQGIFFVNVPGIYTLHKNVNGIHDRDPSGILAFAPRTVDSAELMRGQSETRTNPATAGTVQDSDERANDARTRNGGFDHIEKNAGPGMPLTCFLPKELDLRSKCRESLTPSNGSAAVAAAMGSHDRKDAGIKFKEKRLDKKIWMYNGIHQKGSHFPICVFTNNVGRRSPEKLEERKQTQLQKQQRWGWRRECR